MARSFRKTPIIGITTSPTDAPYKREFHGKSRAYERGLCKKLLRDHEYEVYDPPYYNKWDAPKDGKTWILQEEILSMPHLMRK